MPCNKGEFSSLKKIIIILLAAAILIPITNIIFSGGSRAADIASCRNWAILQSAVKVPTIGIPIKELSNPCVTFQDKAYGDKYEIYETIAKSMHDVWNMYGNGEIDFLSNKEILGQFDSNVYCFIGNEISFKEEQKIDIDDFEEYLSHNYPPKSKLTYSEKFMNAENSKIDFGSGIIEIEKTEKLYIIFAVEKKGPDDFKGVVENLFEAELLAFFGAGAIKGTIPGAEKLFKTSMGTSTLKQQRAPKGGITIKGKFYKGGQFIPKSVLAKTGAKLWGKLNTAGFVMTQLAAVSYITSDQSIMVPSLLVTLGEDIIKEGCELGIHYNPKSEEDKLKFKNV